MALQLHKISAQIDEMGSTLAARARQRARVLPAARELLRQFGDQHLLLSQVAESDVGQRLRCASPGSENLETAFVPPLLPERVTVIATDGSQIYPDLHGIAFYYAINVGSIIYRHGSHREPEVASDSLLCSAEEQVYPNGEPVSSDMVSAERDLAEMRTLAALALREPPGGMPVVALVDGSLLLWLRSAAVPEEQQDRILDEFLSCLDELQRAGVVVAGVVSRPHSAEVVSLLYLAHLGPEERPGIRSLADTPFRGMTDRELFGDLRPGERSALFARGTAANQRFSIRGHRAMFYYLNTGTELARVEVPEWVARERTSLDLVHATVYDQCRLNQGYPYVLTRADEQAVILGEEREALEGLIFRAMLQHGLSLPDLSRKARQKQVARWRRRRK